MKNLPALLFLFFAILSSSVYAQSYYQADQHHPLNGNPYYILPKASLLIQVPVTTTVYKKGKEFTTGYTDVELEVLARKYGVDPDTYKKIDSIGSYQQSAVNEDSVKISVLAKPDYTKVFFTEGEKSWNKNKSVTFTYGADGMVTDGESSVEDKTFDIVVKSLSGIVSVASVAWRGPIDTAKAKPEVTYDELDKILETISGLSSVGIVSNDVYKDVKSSLERKYTKLFSNYFYSETKKIKVLKTYYTPAVKPMDNQPFDLFALNPANGRVTFNQSLQNELWASDLVTGTLTGKVYQLRFTEQSEKFQTAVTIQQMPSDGFAYNLPLRLEVKLTSPKSETIYDDFCKFPQFGTIGRLYTNKNKLSFSLDPINGELKKLTISSSALTTDQAGSVASAASDAIKLARGDSADTKLDNEVKRLDNEVKKRDLLKKLAEPQ
jgi:hypothetical protein